MAIFSLSKRRLFHHFRKSAQEKDDKDAILF